MNKLLSSNFSRLRKEKTFCIAAVFMAVYGLTACLLAFYSIKKNQSTIPFDALFLYGYGLAGRIAVPGVVLAALCSLFVGTEYSDGTLRNKLIAGHTRTEIYFSHFISCAAAGIFLNLIYIAVVCAAGIPLFGGFRMEGSNLLGLILAGTMMLVSYAAVFNMLAMLIQNRTIAAITSLIGVTAAMFLAFYLIERLSVPPFITAWEMKDGNTVSRTIRNTRYLDGGARVICRFLVDLLPSGQSLQISGQKAVHIWRLPLYSLAVAAVTNAVGAISFHRKDLK